MIHIDFQGGAHGNYLEFVCNKIAGIAVGIPFNSIGAAHTKKYTGRKVFIANHYSFLPVQLTYDKIISIQIHVDDLLPLQQISLLRAGDYGYDNDHLEIDTYNKFNNVNYRWVLDSIIQSFFINQIQDSYNAVKDPSWPEVTSLADFQNLPNTLKQECIEQHKLELLELSPLHPDCPRSVLREFFQLGFQQPEQHGFIVRQQQIKYSESKQVYIFPFACFYNKNSFLQEVKKIADWAEISYTCQADISQLHNEFLQRQPYKNSKNKCDELISKIKLTQVVDQTVDLLEEAYINTKLGWDYFV
jgi:hypothetical protein